jgi:hypothetical protein
MPRIYHHCLLFSILATNVSTTQMQFTHIMFINTWYFEILTCEGETCRLIQQFCTKIFNKSHVITIKGIKDVYCRLSSETFYPMTQQWWKTNYLNEWWQINNPLTKKLLHYSELFGIHRSSMTNPRKTPCQLLQGVKLPLLAVFSQLVSVCSSH